MSDYSDSDYAYDDYYNDMSYDAEPQDEGDIIRYPLDCCTPGCEGTASSFRVCHKCELYDREQREPGGWVTYALYHKAYCEECIDHHAHY